MKANGLSGAGVTGVALIASFLVAGSTSTVMLEDVDNINLDAKRMMNDVLQEITTYLKIDDAIGKYYNTGTNRQIERIILFVKQYISNNINMSQITIGLYNSEDVVLLKYSGDAFEVGSNTLFQHYAWESLENNTFGALVINDEDRSLLDHNVMNDELVYILIPLPEQFKMGKGESMTVSIIPDNGITTSIYLEPPSFHSKNIISFNQI